MTEKKYEPYPGFPETHCPVCEGSTRNPHRRWPACKLCNPYPPEPTPGGELCQLCEELAGYDDAEEEARHASLSE